jgi:hypothetical protein
MCVQARLDETLDESKYRLKASGKREAAETARFFSSIKNRGVTLTEASVNMGDSTADRRDCRDLVGALRGAVG